MPFALAKLVAAGVIFGSLCDYEYAQRLLQFRNLTIIYQPVCAWLAPPYVSIRIMLSSTYQSSLS